MTTRLQMLRRVFAILLAVLAPLGMTHAQTVAPPAAEKPAPAPEAKPSGDASTAREMHLEPRPALALKGESSWDDGYEKLLASFKALRAEARRLGLVATAKPLTAFLHTDDQGFRFEALLALEKAPDDALKPGKTFTFTKTPAGKAFAFKHTGAYDDIDSTYEAITAWLDEKGLSAKGAFLEEYLTEPEESDDTLLELNVYVFVE